MSKTKILIIDNSLALTGAIRSILNSIILISEYEFRFCFSTKSKLHAEVSNYKTIGLPFFELRKSPSVIFYLPILIFNSFRLIRIIKKENIKIIHINDLYNMLGVAVKVFYPRIKVVYHVRLLPSSYVGLLFNSWCSLISKFADRIILVSNAVNKAWKKSAKTIVIHDSISHFELKEVQHVSKDTPLQFLYLANYISGKGHGFALEAFAKVLPKLKDAKLNFYGGDMGLKKNQLYKSQLQRDVKLLNLEGFVEINDLAADIKHLMQHNDIFLNFSESESFSMTCLEALNFGCPTIATDCGGPSEIIENNISGIIVPNRDVEAMSEAMIRLAFDDKLRNLIKKSGNERVRKDFASAQQSELLKKVYFELLTNDINQ